MIEPLSDAKIRYEPYASWKSLDRASSSSSSAVEQSALPTKTLFFSEKRHLNSRIRVSNFEFQFLNCFKQLFLASDCVWSAADNSFEDKVFRTNFRNHFSAAFGRSNSERCTCRTLQTIEGLGCFRTPPAERSAGCSVERRSA